MCHTRIRLLLVLLLSGAGLCAGEEPARARIRRGDFRPRQVLSGTLVAARSEEFKAPLTSTWRVQIKWMVPEGGEVKTGEPVVRFDTANIAADLETTRDALKNKREEKSQLEADFRFRKFELEVGTRAAENDARQKALDASIPPELVSRFDYDKKQLDSKKSGHALADAKSKMKVALAEVETKIRTAEIEIGESQAKLDRLQIDLKGLILTARTAGPLIYAVDSWRDRKVQVGDVVSATSTVAHIPDRSSLEVEAWIAETHIQQVRAGQRARLRLDAYPEREFFGAVREVSRTAEARKQWGKANFFRVAITLDRRDGEIMKPGMSVKCEVVGTPLRDVLLVPLEVAFFDGSTFWVRPPREKARKLVPCGFDEFVIALRPKENPTLRADMTLTGLESLDGPAGK
ncbi:MAG TPA: HlyD family efflux transporter periplasmic adaptor subunit [Candidatus Aminicenantes bacterium]|nr:HlyD family efflux transporter periplasmic adaptor subunit [Candidatus Aminicenantes bacterium]